MVSDSGSDLTRLRVDGGMVANDWLLQFLADIINTEVEKPTIIETTALGAAYLAGLQQGVFQSTEQISTLWKRSNDFNPAMNQAHRQQLLSQWQLAIQSVITNNRQ
jgi:glycerol kinase